MTPVTKVGRLEVRDRAPRRASARGTAAVALAMALALACPAGGRLARAETPERDARRLYQTGLESYRAGNYDEAIARLKASYHASRHQGLLYDLAQAQRLKGDCTSARTLYRQFLDHSPRGSVETLSRTISYSPDGQISCRCRPRPSPAPRRPGRARPTLDRRTWSRGRPASAPSKTSSPRRGPRRRRQARRLLSSSIAFHRSASGTGRRVHRARLGGRHRVLRLARRPSVGQGVEHVLAGTDMERHRNERRAVGTLQRDLGRRHRSGGPAGGSPRGSRRATDNRGGPPRDCRGGVRGSSRGAGRGTMSRASLASGPFKAAVKSRPSRAWGRSCNS